MSDQPPQTPDPFGDATEADLAFMREMQAKVAAGDDLTDADKEKIGEIAARHADDELRHAQPLAPPHVTSNAHEAVPSNGVFEAELEPTLEEVQDKLRARLPLTEIERQVAARADIHPPSDYPTTVQPAQVELEPPRQGPTLLDQLAELTIEDRLARLEKLQLKTMNMLRNVLAEIGRSTGREHELMRIMEEQAPESRDVLTVG